MILLLLRDVDDAVEVGAEVVLPLDDTPADELLDAILAADLVVLS